MNYRLLYTLENGRRIYSETLGQVDIFTKKETIQFTPVLNGRRMAFSRDYSMFMSEEELKQIGCGMFRVRSHYWEPTVIQENKKYRQIINHKNYQL